MSSTERTPLLSPPNDQSVNGSDDQSNNRSNNRSISHFFKSKLTIIILIVFLIACWVIYTLSQSVHQSVNQSINRLIHTDGVIVSSYDPRSYHYLELPNKLRILVISDERMIDNSVSMSVKVGFYNDPVDVPGLAHFVEHELFAGSAKYPLEDQFKTDVLNAAGHMNAFTKEEETNFYFKVNHRSINQIIDQFAQFFISPKFGLQRINREMHAIDSEHQKRINVDDRRRYEILARATSHKSPLQHYSTGDVTTLNRSDISTRLRSFHSYWYSANRMTCVLMGPQPVNQLVTLATNSFSDVPNKDTPDAVYEELPLINHSNEQPHKKIIDRSINQSINQSVAVSFAQARRYTGNIVYLKPVRDSHILTVYWQQPSEQPVYDVMPSRYMSSLLMNKGENGFIHKIKRRGWGSFVTASVEASVTSFSLYHVRIGLTNNGLQHVDEVIDELYDYIHAIKSAVQRRYQDDLIDMEKVHFLYPAHIDPSHEANQIATRMHFKKVPDLMMSTKNRNFDKKLIEQYLSNLRPKDSLVLLSSSTFSKPYFKGGKVEVHYSIPYISYALPDTVLDRWTRIFEHGNSIDPLNDQPQHFSLVLPHPYQPTDQTNNQSNNQIQYFPYSLPASNPFIPRSFDIIAEENHDFPILIVNSSVSRVWLRSIKQSNKKSSHQSPMASISFEYRAPALLNNVENQAINQLYVALVRESFSSLGSSAEFAGYTWSVDAIPNAVRVSVSGFASELLTVFHRLVEHLVSPSIDRERFDYVRGLLFERRDNIWLAIQPYEQALYFAQLITEQHKFSDSALMQAAQAVNQTMLESFMPRLFAAGYVEMFGYGNIDRDTIEQANQYVTSMLNIHEVQSDTDQSIEIVIIKSNNQTINETIIRSRPRQVNPRQLPAYRVYRLPPGRYLYQPPPIQRSNQSNNQSIHRTRNQNVNSAVYVSLFTRSYHSVTASSRLRLLQTLLSPFCASRLRSQLQLGYTVRCFTTIHFNTVQSLDVLVQGSEYDAAYMDERVEEMLMDFEDVLLSLNSTQFVSARRATIQAVTDRPQSFTSMFQSDWSHIVGLDRHFNRSLVEAEHLHYVTKQDVVDFYRRYVAPHTQRRRLSVEIFGHHHTPRLPTGSAAPTAIIEEKNRQATKTSWEVYELDDEDDQVYEHYPEHHLSRKYKYRENARLRDVIDSMWKRANVNE